MDGYGIAIAIVGGIVWMASGKKSPIGAKIGALILGIGLGILIGAVGAYYLTIKALGG